MGDLGDRSAGSGTLLLGYLGYEVCLFVSSSAIAGSCRVEFRSVEETRLVETVRIPGRVLRH